MNKQEFESLIKMGYSVTEALKLLGSSTEQSKENKEEKEGKEEKEKHDDGQSALLSAIQQLTETLKGTQVEHTTKKIGDHKQTDSFNELLKHMAE